MLTYRPSPERVLAAHGWLNSRHTFSFGDYYDPAHMGFRALRVINEDLVAPGAGFGEHGHRDMEIITVVKNGVLEHKDSLGNGAPIKVGDVQRMTAGTGILHSEFNGSETSAVEFLQIWLMPEAKGLKPSYAQMNLPHSLTPGVHLLAAPAGDGVVLLNHSTRLYRVNVGKGEEVSLDLVNGGYAWVQVFEGDMSVDSQALDKGDGLALSEVTQLTIKGGEKPAAALVFDLA
jgi:redox-sensitive bicupin YhaK (pirin superfamily)